MNKQINIIGKYKENGLTKVKINKAVMAVFDFTGQRKKVNIAFVSNKEIQELNKKFRQKNVPTDVLSFDYEDEADISLSLSKINEMKDESETLVEAALKTIIHGVLHLFGYDDENEKDRAIMNETEVKIWEKL